MHPSGTYLKTQGDSRALVTRKHGIVPSNEIIKALIHNIGKRDPIPPGTTGERYRVLRDKLIKIVLSVVWDVWALRDRVFTSTPTIAMGRGHGWRAMLNQSQPIARSRMA